MRRLLGALAFLALALGTQAPIAGAAATTATGRAYELVSPADKNGFPVNWLPVFGGRQPTNVGLNAAARDGETVTFTSWGTFAGSESSIAQNYRSRRTASGWVTTPASSALNAHQPKILSPSLPTWWAAGYDLHEGVMQTSNSWSPFDGNKFEPAPGAGDVYMRNAADEDVLISADEGGQAVGGFDSTYYPSYIAGEGGQVLFQSQRHFVAADEGRTEGTYNVYENDGSGARLVSVAPGGGVADPACGASIPPEPSNLIPVVSAPQSADGSRVIFQTSGSAGGGEFLCSFLNPPQLYVRVDGKRTIQLSKSQRTEPDPEGVREASFVGASEDFSRIFFTSREKLSDDANNPPGSQYIYEFDLESEELSVVVIDSQRAVAISADGSSLFFLGAGSEGAEAIFRAREGTVTPVAASPFGPLQRSSASMAVIASDDGRSLVFSVNVNVTSYDSQETDQVYLWREGEPLRCLSCNEAGAGTPTNAHISTGNESTRTISEPRRYADSLTADGSLVTFDTGTKLLPNDTNGRQDVYEYDVEADRLSLVTDGRSDQDAFLLGMSRSGRDVFFVTAAGLVSPDTDSGVDLYDARVGGGFPEGVNESVRSCAGEACQSPAALPPAAGTPATTQVDGPSVANQRRAANCRKAKNTKGKKAQRAKARCAKRTNKNQSKKKGKGSDRRASVPAGMGKGEGK
jgi:hypothetical protein